MQVFAANAKDSQLGPLLSLIESSATKHKDKELKAFCAFWDEKPEALTQLNKTLHLDDVGLTMLQGPKDEALKGYFIDTRNKTTVLVYKNRKVTASFVNYDAKKDAARLQAALDDITR